MGEQVECDSERVTALAPAIDAEEGHADELHERVTGREQRERRWIVAVDEHKLEPGEAEDPDHGRPTSEPVGVGEWLADQSAGSGAPAGPGDPARDRSPWIEWPEHVAQECAQDRDRDPEQDVDHRRGQIAGRDLAADDPAVDRQREQGHGDHATDRVEVGGQAEQPTPRRGVLQARCGPQPAEADEGDDQHRTRGPGEQPRRERQVGPSHEAVRGGERGPHQRDHDQAERERSSGQAGAWG